MKILETPIPLHCHGCGRRFGFSKAESTLVRHMYCSDACIKDFPVRDHEERDSLILELHRRGRTYEEIADLFSISKQRVGQIMFALREGISA